LSRRTGLSIRDRSGQEFVAAYRQMPSHHAAIVVVSAVENARRIARDLGAAAFIAKPFSVDELAEVVQRVTPAPDARPQP
jgi:DNA-binding LytR/AlgR family response regulator